MNFFKRIFGGGSEQKAEATEPRDQTQEEFERLLEREFDENPGNWTYQVHSRGETYLARNIRGLTVMVRCSAMGSFVGCCGSVSLGHRLATKIGTVAKEKAERALAEEETRRAANDRKHLIKILKG